MTLLAANGYIIACMHWQLFLANNFHTASVIHVQYPLVTLEQ
jgi:hypothetical protein